MKSYNMKSFLLIVLLGISSISAAQNLLDLSGNWELALDSTDVERGMVSEIFLR
jgi:hypothetical protein